MEYEDPTLFEGIRFVLAGFSPSNHQEVKRELVSRGGVYIPQYSPDCTHVIVDKLLIDDPICVAARRDGKILATHLWIEHVLEGADLSTITSVMYRPPKGPNGVPGAEKLVICLTGYPKQDREDIMIMVELMGAHFSKSLVPAKVTHLLCFKFEGEKYLAAKRFGIKLVNHQWLEGCLKAWKILPEEHYSKSSYELELMEAEVKDSQEETGDTSAELSDRRVTNEQALDDSVIASKVPTLPVQGLSNTVRIDEVSLPLKPEQLLGSTNLQKLSPMRQNSDEQKAKKTPVKAGLTSHVGETSGNLTRPPSSKRSADTLTDFSTPLNSTKTAKRPNVSAGKSGSSNKKTKEYLKSDLRTSVLEVDKVKVASTSVGALYSKGLSDADACNYDAPSPLRSPRRTSLSLQSVARLTTPEGMLQDLAEKVTADVGASTIEPAKNISASELVRLPSAKAVRPDGDGLIALHQMKELADHPETSHITPKSQKLMASGSKRIDAADPATPVSSPIGKSKSDPNDISRHTGNESMRASADKSSTDVQSVKSNMENIAISRSLAFDKAKISTSENVDTRTSPSSGNVALCAPTGVKSNKVKPQILPENASFSPELKELEASKSGDPKLNSDEKTGSSITKPTRKKMVARKTLGSRAKVSKKAVDDKTGSLPGNFTGDNAALHQTGQIEGKALADSSVPDKIMVPSIGNASIALNSKPLQDSAVDINDYAKADSLNGRPAGLIKPFNDDTEALPDFSLQHRSNSTESSPLREPRARETSGMLHCHIDEAEVTNSPSENTHKKGMPVATSNAVEHAKQTLAPKKGISGRAKGKTVIRAQKEVVQDADDAVGGKASEKKEQTVTAAGKKRRGSQLAKGIVQVDEVLVTSDDPGACNGSKGLGNLALKKRRGTLVLNKSNTSVELEREVEPALDKDGQDDCDKQPEKLLGKSKPTEVLTELENENGRIAGNGGCNNNGKKQTGKKRRGTLLLNNSEVLISAEKENFPVLNGKPGKLSSTSNLTESTKEANDPNVGDDQGAIKGKKIAGKKRRGTLVLNKAEGPFEVVKENWPVSDDLQGKSKGEAPEPDLTVSNGVSSGPVTSPSDSTTAKTEPAWFIVSGHRLQRKEFQQLIKHLKGKHCRDSHQWSYQATHFIVPDPIRRTEKFFAAAASGRWILNTDYLTASSQAGKFLPEEPYEWHKNGLTEDGAINLEAPRKWRLLREKTGHGAFYGMRIVVYGECIAPPLDTLKRAVKAGDGTILATSPPYTRFLDSGVDFAIVSPGMPRVDMWVQEFLSHEIPCVTVDYLVEYVCKPGYPLDRHVQYNTHEWAAKSFARLSNLLIESVADAATPEDQVTDDLACEVCGSSDRAEVMLVCGDERGSSGCGIGTHIDCCDPSLEGVPEEDWFCPACIEPKTEPPASTKKKTASKRR